MLIFSSTPSRILKVNEVAVSQTFGLCIRQARREKEYSQRELAALVKVDYTYLSKLENDRVTYPPKDEVIQALAQHLELDVRALTVLAGRITPEDAEVVNELMRTHPENMPVLLRTMRDNPKVVQEMLDRVQQSKNQEDS
jgi:HTH-type transcriptional regulator, competence development regulator